MYRAMMTPLVVVAVPSRSNSVLAISRRSPAIGALADRGGEQAAEHLAGLRDDRLRDRLHRGVDDERRLLLTESPRGLRDSTGGGAGQEVAGPLRGARDVRQRGPALLLQRAF